MQNAKHSSNQTGTEFQTLDPGADRLRRTTRAACAVLVFSLATGCAFVQPVAGASNVGVADDAGEVEGCKHVGDIRANTKSNVGIIDRNPDRIREELLALARNNAVEMGADTVLAIGEPTREGTQKFRAYRCP